jgi:hypothetical protein
MAKNRGDVILRDRLQFTLDGSGDLTTVYGRVDLSQFTAGKKGLAIKEVRFQLRDPTNGNCGIFRLDADDISSSGSAADYGGYKLFATTRAYENAADVGIASPDVLCVEEGQWIVGPYVQDNNYDPATGAGNNPGGWAIWERDWYGPEDLHPEGFTVVTDLLIGIAVDGWNREASQTIELDVLLVADPVTLTTERMNALYTQAQDL